LVARHLPKGVFGKKFADMHCRKWAKISRLPGLVGEAGGIIENFSGL
jgi:hypothetical protein